jgi:hypothetical protein
VLLAVWYRFVHGVSPASDALMVNFVSSFGCSWATWIAHGQRESRFGCSWLTWIAHGQKWIAHGQRESRSGSSWSTL